MLERGPQRSQHRPTAVRHAHDCDAFGVYIGLLREPGAGAVCIVRPAHRPCRYAPGVTHLFNAARPEAVDHGSADAMLAKDVRPGLDPAGPHGFVAEASATMQQHDKGKRAGARGFVDRNRQRSLGRPRPALLDSARLEAVGVPGAPGHDHLLSRRRVRRRKRCRQHGGQCEARKRRVVGDGGEAHANARPASRSSTRIGARSGWYMAATGSCSVCSSMNWPRTTACET